MNEITTKRDPDILAMEIRTLQQQAESILTSYIIEIGRRLCEAKAVLEHGEWGTWLREQVQFSQSTANNYMKIFERFGDDQISLFGAPKSQAIGNLPYTKALKLLALPEDEVEDFLEEHPVTEMSTRELEKAIRERDEARKSAEDTRALIDAAEKSKAEAEARVEELRRELEELKARPVEVAVQEPSPEMLDMIRQEEAQKAAVEREKLEKKLAAAEEKAKRESEKTDRLKAEADKMADSVREELKKDMEAAEEAKAEAEARAKALEERLKSANGDASAFKVYFQSVQENMNRMLGMIQKAEPEQQAKFRAAVKALLESIGKAVDG